MLLTEPLLSCPCCVFGVIVMLEDSATTHLQCSYWGKEVVGQNLMIHGPIHPSRNTVQLSNIKSYILVSFDHMTFSHASSGSSRWSLTNFRRAWTCAGLSRGTLRALQDSCIEPQSEGDWQSSWISSIFFIIAPTVVAFSPSCLPIVL